jgi:hypothetical protein
MSFTSLGGQINLYRDISFFAVVDHIFCALGAAIPEGQNEIGIFNDGDAEFQRGGLPIPAVLWQAFCKLVDTRPQSTKRLSSKLTPLLL